MKRERDDNDDDDDDDDNQSSIDYGEKLLMGIMENDDDDDDDNNNVEDDFVPMKLDSSIDCNLTRADYQETEILSMYEQICMFAALCLYVEHHETFGEDEVDFKRKPLLDSKPPKFRLGN